MARRLASVLFALATVAAPAGAQRRGDMEGGILGRGTLFDPSIRQPHTAVGVGARIGAYATSRWLLEADFSASVGEGLDYQAFHLRMNFLEQFEPRGQLVMGLGYVRNHYTRAVDGSDGGLSGAFGLRFELARSVFARVDGTLDYMPAPANGAGDNWHLGIQLGGGYRLSRR